MAIGGSDELHLRKKCEALVWLLASESSTPVPGGWEFPSLGTERQKRTGSQGKASNAGER